MTYEPNLETMSGSIIKAREWGIGVITTSLGLGMFISEIQRVKDNLYDPLSIGYLILFGVTGILVFLWIWATQKELGLCFYWLDPERYSPPSSLKETLIKRIPRSSTPGLPHFLFAVRNYGVTK